MCSAQTKCIPIHDVPQKLHLSIMLKGVKNCFSEILWISLYAENKWTYEIINKMMLVYHKNLRLSLAVWIIYLICSTPFSEFIPPALTFSAKNCCEKRRHGSYNNPLFVFLWICSLKATLSGTECNSQLREVKSHWSSSYWKEKGF